MTVTSILARTARGLVVAAVAAGLFAGAAVMPASASTPAASAVAAPSASAAVAGNAAAGNAAAAAAALGNRTTFTAECTASKAYVNFGIALDSLAGYTYAVRIDAYAHVGKGWQWAGALTGFQYRKVVPGSYYFTDPYLTVAVPSLGFYSFVAEVYVWTAQGWSQPFWYYASHSQVSTHRPIQDASWCGAFTNI